MKKLVLLLKYLNCEPIRIALKSLEDVEIISSIPSKIIQDVYKLKPDIVMTPITVIKSMEKLNYKISNICISSKGPVRSVGIFYRDNMPIENIDTIYATKESSVSIRIVKYIFRRLLDRDLSIVPVDIDNHNLDKFINSKPTLLIGDLALKASLKYVEVVDIGEEWFKIFKIPLVYAVLVFREGCKDCKKIIESLGPILQRDGFMREVIKKSSHPLINEIPRDVLFGYFKHNIKYILDYDLLLKCLDFEFKILCT